MRLSLITALVLLFGAGIARPQDTAASSPTGSYHDVRLLPQDLLKAFRSDARRLMESSHIPGLSIAIVVDRKLAWTEGFGHSDIENRVAAKAVTSYRWASISKSITGVAVMQQVERGKMRLDDDIRLHVPDFPGKAKGKVTIRDLLCHQSGVRHYKRGEILSTRLYGSLVEALPVFKDDPLRFQPGADYGYTTYGYTLLGLAVEKTSGLSFPDYLKTHIFKPAGMTTARDDSAPAIIPHRAQGYVRTDEGLVNSRLADTSYKIPGGGLCGSVRDLARFATATLENRLVSAVTFERAAAPQKTKDGKVRRYGLGWSVQVTDGHKIVGHGGAQQRVSSWLGMSPKDGTAVVVISNLEKTGGAISKLATGFLNRLAK